MEHVPPLEDQLSVLRGKNRAEFLDRLFFDYISREPQRALSFAQQVLWTAETQQDLISTAAALKNLGIAYDILGEYPQALEYYQRALEISKQLNDQVNLAKILNNMGILCKNRGDLSSAIDYYMYSLKINENLKDQKGIAASYNNLGDIYQVTRNPEKALEYFLKVLSIVEIFEDFVTIATCQYNIGLVYEDLANIPDALSYQYLAFQSFEKVQDYLGIACTLESVGNIQRKIGNYFQALAEHQQALTIRQKIGNKNGITSSLLRMSAIYLELQNYAVAHTYVERGLQLAEEIGDKRLTKEALNLYAKLAEIQGDFQKALAYFQRFTKIKDEIFAFETHEKIAHLQAKYELKKKEQEVEVLGQRAIEDQLARKHIEISMTELKKLSQLKDDFLSCVSHELRTPVTNMRMSIYLLKQSGLKDEQLSYLNILEAECNREIQLINDLLDLQLSESGSKTLNTETIDLIPWLTQLMLPFAGRLQEKQISFELIFQPGIGTVTTDRISLERILVELVNNACKYTPSQETIRVTVHLEKLGLVQFQVINTGVMISAQELPRIFEKFYRIPTQNLWEQSGTGLGLSLVQASVLQLGGDIEVDSKDNMTMFTVMLPNLKAL